MTFLSQETIADLFELVRSRLGSPSHDYVTDPDIIDALAEAQTLYKIVQANKNENHLVEEDFISVRQGCDVYELPGRVKKPLRVEAYDTGAPRLHGMEIKMVELENEDQIDRYLRDNYSTFRNDGYGGYSGGANAYLATAIIFYGSPLKARPVPHPSSSRKYRLFYQPTLLVANDRNDARVEGPEDFKYLYIYEACHTLIPKAARDASVNIKEVRQTITEKRMMLLREYDKFSSRLVKPDKSRRKRYRPGGSRTGGYR